jgi:kynurenine formamidase
MKRLRRPAAGIVWWLGLVAAGVPGVAAGQRPGRVVDLGHSLAATDPSWTGTPVFERTGTPKNGRIATDEHFGTHLDAPVHFGGTWSVDRIPVDRFVRPGVAISVTGQPDDYQITLADLKAWEARHGAIPEGSIVLFATGWDARWSDPIRYWNEKGGVKHFPGIAVEAARYLTDRKVVGIGIDTPSVDYGPSEKYETHNITNPAGIYHIENATNLTTLPPTGFTVVVAPINIAGGSGGPTRIFALLP